ncbi:MAG TPA: hypothetical protein VFQ53_30820 [Kofleriaceae bacterium]|nr:hypothetical protein [Kofleriaceae bacterium]
MAGELRLFDVGLAHLYARAVLAIARAGDELGLEEGLRLQERIEARSGHLFSLDDLLLHEPLTPSELAAQLRTASSPFRGANVHTGELAAVIVEDALMVVLAKGYVSEAEGRELVRFATALGLSVEEVRELSKHVAPFLSALDGI